MSGQDFRKCRSTLRRSIDLIPKTANIRESPKSDRIESTKKQTEGKAEHARPTEVAMANGESVVA